MGLSWSEGDSFGGRPTHRIFLKARALREHLVRVFSRSPELLLGTGAPFRCRSHFAVRCAIAVFKRGFWLFRLLSRPNCSPRVPSLAAQGPVSGPCRVSQSFSTILCCTLEPNVCSPPDLLLLCTGQAFDSKCQPKQRSPRGGPGRGRSDEASYNLFPALPRSMCEVRSVVAHRRCTCTAKLLSHSSQVLTGDVSTLRPSLTTSCGHGPFPRPWRTWRRVRCWSPS